MNDVKPFKVVIFKDTSRPCLGLHGMDCAFLGLPGVDLAALWDANPNLDEAKALQYCGARKRYFDRDEMMEKEKPDIVVITSRDPRDHLPQLRVAAAYGCHVYCEKPVSTNLEEADEAVRLADEHHLKIAVQHAGRYSMEYSAMKAAVARGEIGTLLKMTSYGKCDHRGGGEDLMTLGTHLLDLMIFFAGDPVSVRAELCTGGVPTPPDERTKTVEDVGPCAGEEVVADFRFANGVRGTFESRRNLFSYSYGNGSVATNMGFSVIGTDGILNTRFTDFFPEDPVRICRTRYPAEYGAPFELFPAKETRVIPGEVPMNDFKLTSPGIPHTRMLLDGNRFAAWDLLCAIREDRMPVASVHHARTALEMIYGIYASHLKGGARVTFPLKNRKHPLESAPDELD